MHTLTLRAGQTGRLSFTFSPEGDYTLAGAVRAEGKDAALEANGADLFIPALPPGLHLLEVRANGRTVMYGGLEVLPSPLEDASGEVAWAVNADLAETIASVSITLTEGPQGPQGEKGEQGDPGPQGEQGGQGDSAYEVAVANGFSGTETEWLASLRPTKEEVQEAVSVEFWNGTSASISTPAGSDNANAHYIELDAQHVPSGSLTSISIMSRPAGNNPSTYSYLGLWEQNEAGTAWEYLGSSQNAPGQSAGEASNWQFEDIILHGRRLRLLPQSTRSGTFATGNAIGLCVAATPSGDTSKYVYSDADYSYLPQLTINYKQNVGAIDSTPTEGSTNAVSSGGVYEALLHKGTGTNSTEIGAGAVAASYALAVGASASASSSSVAVGYGASMGSTYGVVIGRAAASASAHTVAIGYNAKANGSQSVSIGASSAANANAIAVGDGAKANSSYGVSIGSSSTTSANGIAVGASAKASSSFGVSIGPSSTASANAIAVGASAKANSSYGVSIGSSSTTSANAIAVGYNARANAINSVVLGYGSIVNSGNATAIGYQSQVEGAQSTAIGYKTQTGEGGCTVVSGWSTDGAIQSLLYFIGAGSGLSNTYLGGEAGLGFVQKDSSGKITAAGCRKLSELLTDHATDFTPDGLTWATDS